MIASAANAAPNMEDDSRLVQQVLAGNDAAFEQLVHRHSRKVARIAGSYFSSRENVEDLVQDVFLKVYQSLDRFRLGEPFEPWLIRITINACYDELRKIRKRREFSLTPPSEEEGQWMEENLNSLRSSPKDPEEQHLVKMVVGRMLDRLPPKDRAALTLRGEGFSLREIGEALGCSMQAANLRLFRARRSLLKTLREARIVATKRK
jgi:RNA polymerase sigma-70 factor, ECF subfamily